MIKKFTTVILFVTVCNGCNEASNEKQAETQATEQTDQGSVLKQDSSLQNNDTSFQKAPIKRYSNERFRNVAVTKVEDQQFLIEGTAQVFEATFGWVIEDGHSELQQGFVTTDAGAPEWGKFSFKVKASRANVNSTLHIVLFETSAKDGSRQHELPIALPE